jgi:hypothetical protein
MIILVGKKGVAIALPFLPELQNNDVRCAAFNFKDFLALSKLYLNSKGVAIALPFSSNSLRTQSLLRSLYFISTYLDFQAELESK